MALKNLYDIKVMLERVGLKQRKKSIPKYWGREFGVMASTAQEAFGVVCDQYRNRGKRHYKITLRECVLVSRHNDIKDEPLRRNLHETV